MNELNGLTFGNSSTTGTTMLDLSTCYPCVYVLIHCVCYLVSMFWQVLTLNNYEKASMFICILHNRRYITKEGTCKTCFQCLECMFNNRELDCHACAPLCIIYVLG